MWPRQFTKAEEQVLRDQVITADHPGSVVRDFGMLLDALGSDGIEAGGKYHLIAIKLIDALDQRLTRPLRLELKRPQIRSHPYLQALNLLLRATGLARVEGTGTKARLCVDPALKMQWDGLNPTEQYFNLFEAAFRLARMEMAGEQSRFSQELLLPCLMTWVDTPEGGRAFDLDKPENIYLNGVSRYWYMLALMDLFGLMTVENPPAPIITWHPAGLRHLPFGDAVFLLLASRDLHFSDDEPEDEEVEEDDETSEELYLSEDDFEDEEDEDVLDEHFLGAWQPLFQPFFPEWRRNLEIPREVPREGMFLFRVSLGKVWRRIATPSVSTLEDLAYCILKSVNFDSDHLYEFTYTNRLGIQCSVQHPAMDRGPWADGVTIGELPLDPGQSMTFLFDFGDNWKFHVKLERIDPLGAKKKPQILERQGKSPPQYPSWDD